MDSKEITPVLVPKTQGSQGSVDVYAVQCGQCSKWRIIPTQEEFEDLRSRFLEDPFFCNKKPDVSCDDPADIEYDATRTWILDKPNLPKTPKGFKRTLVLRRDFSKMDAYYVTPSGKRLRSIAEIASYIQANPEHKDVSLSEFNFHPPKVMEETVPENIERKVSASKNKKLKPSKEADV